MSQVQLYIQGQRMDLFDEEAIEVKRVIQDAKDIGKVFTDFSKPFILPASQANNKIFKHFYNFNIQGGFDARVKVPGEIYLNHQLYKRGKIFLASVNMRNNAPYSYEVTFFGNTVGLNDKIGDDKLSDLDLSDFDHTYSYTNVKSIFRGDGFTPSLSGPGFVASGDTTSLIYPLITSKRRLFYNTTLNNTTDADIHYDGNLHFFTDAERGVSHEDLKPAVKIHYIIKAIEAKYDLVLIPNDTIGTKDFLSRHNAAISNLYLWFSNNSGNITNRVDGNNYFFTNIADNLVLDADSDDDFSFFSASGQYATITSTFTDDVREKGGSAGNGFGFYLRVDPGPSYNDVPWRVYLRDEDNPGSYVATMEGTGDQTFFINGSSLSGKSKDKRYFIELQSKSAMEQTEIRFYCMEFKPGVNDQEMYSDLVSTDSENMKAKSNVPDMKVLEFLDGLMKMFNLTAYVIDDESDPEYGVDSQGTPNVVKITTLSEFYNDAVNNQTNGLIDVTEYIDIESHKVATSLPFSELNFKYQDSETLLRKNHLESFGDSFGDARHILRDEYDFDNSRFYGDKYEIKVPFEILKYEHIRDESDNTTNIQWGYAAGGDFQTTGDTPPKGDYQSKDVKPLLFYGISVGGILEAQAESMNFMDNTGANFESVNRYYRPSNTSALITVDSDGIFSDSAPYHLTFDAEIDEFTGAPATNTTKTLFFNFYKDYVKSVFDKDKRMFTFQAHLPPKILTVLKLNDQLKIQDVVYRINSITTNLVNGKSKLELINLNSTEIVE